MVTRQDIREAMERAGVEQGGILLFHSSLKSFGHVEGGADAVIDGMLDALGPEGTLVAPTLVQRDFANAYRNWNKDTSPSDVGLISETLRLRKEACRSDQATHSCAAIGRLADELTRDHGTVGPRFHLFGDYAFSYGSPWQKMYDLGGKVAFLGVTLRCNTYRHFMETRLMERGLNAVRDPQKRAALQAELAVHEHWDEFLGQLDRRGKDGTPMTMLYPQVDAQAMLKLEEPIEKAGYIRRTVCGDAAIMVVDIRGMVEVSEKAVCAAPEEYIYPQEADWFRRLWAAAE